MIETDEVPTIDLAWVTLEFVTHNDDVFVAAVSGFPRMTSFTCDPMVFRRNNFPHAHLIPGDMARVPVPTIAIFATVLKHFRILFNYSDDRRSR